MRRLKAMDGLPMQPIEWDGHGVIRFRQNRIVQYLLNTASGGGKCDMNDIAVLSHQGKFTKAEQMQFAQLIGYSVSGFGDLPYAARSVVVAADRAADKLHGESAAGE